MHCELCRSGLMSDATVCPYCNQSVNAQTKRPADREDAAGGRQKICAHCNYVALYPEDWLRCARCYRENCLLVVEPRKGSATPNIEFPLKMPSPLASITFSKVAELITSLGTKGIATSVALVIALALGIDAYQAGVSLARAEAGSHYVFWSSAPVRPDGYQTTRGKADFYAGIPILSEFVRSGYSSRDSQPGVNPGAFGLFGRDTNQDPAYNARENASRYGTTTP